MDDSIHGSFDPVREAADSSGRSGDPSRASNRNHHHSRKSGPPSWRRPLQSAAVIAAGLLGANSLQAGSAFYDFNTDPSSLMTLVGTAQWVPSGGTGSATNSSDGYLQITPNVNSSTGAILFNDFDNGLIVGAFHISADLKVGDGSGTPADGFSINYVRANDPLIAALQGGNSGIDWGGYDAGDQGGYIEDGSATGLGIGFDAYSNAGDDPTGLYISVDDVIKTTILMPTLNGACTDATSIQTGPVGDGTGSSLCWAHLDVDLTTNGLLNVTWKGTVILTNFQTGYLPSAGRLVMGGRTGGLNENQWVDNISITTYAATYALVSGVAGSPDGFTLSLSDSGPSVVDTNSIKLTFNGAAATPNSITKNGTATSVTYANFANLLASGSTNSVAVTFKDANGVALSGNVSFVVPAYSTLVTTPGVTVSTAATNSGFQVYPWHTAVSQPNDVNQWTEAQILGQEGTNYAQFVGWNNSQSGLNENALLGAQGYYFPYTNYINWDVVGPNGGDGNFTANNNYPENEFPGINLGNYPNEDPSTVTDVNNFTELVETWLYLPAGVYTMGVSSDDGFSVKNGKTPADVTGQLLGEFEGGRGAANTLFTVVAPTSGFYPFRLLYEEGGGGADCEWFTVSNGVIQLINDYTNIVQAYQVASAYPPVVSGVLPTIGAGILGGTTAADGAGPLVVQVVDGNPATVSSVKLTLNGKSITPTVTKTNGLTYLYYTTAPVTPTFLGGLNTVSAVITDSANHITTNTWRFNATSVGVFSAANAASAVNTSATNVGFIVYPWQTVDGQPNDAAVWTEAQIAGWYGENTAVLTNWNGATSLQGPHGLYYPWTSYINWDAYGPNATDGDFQIGTGNGYPKSEFPGFVIGENDGATPPNYDYSWEAGAAFNSVNNFSELVEAWFYLPAAGEYQMIVNSDDGFTVKSGQAPGDVFGTVLGEFIGGRGATDTTFSFLVPAPGYYPFRLLYEEGGGGANCEWITVSNGVKSLINDTSDANSWTPYMSASNSPIYVQTVSPVNGQGGVPPNRTVVADVVDGTPNQVASVSILLNGQPATVQTSKKGAVTTAWVTPTPGADALINGATNVATIIYTDTAHNSYTNSWSFTTATTELADNNVTSLDPSLSFPVGSGDTNSPGFLAQTVQIAPRSGTQANTVEWAEQMLAGLGAVRDANVGSTAPWFTNVANLADKTYGPLTSGYWMISNYINLAGDYTLPNVITGTGGDGDFVAANGYPDTAVPGVPGLVKDSGGNLNESVSVEFKTWLEFPAAGEYTFVVSSDDGFRAYEATNHGRLTGLNITAPASLAKMYPALPADPETGSGLIGAPLPLNGFVSGNLVLANPPFGDNTNGVLLNAAAVKGNIVLIQRGNVSFQVMANEAAAAGATALVVMDSAANAGSPPTTLMGGTNAGIPAILIGNEDGLALTNAAAAGTAQANIGDNGTSLRLGEANYGKGWSDVLFTVYAPQAGDYPIRLVYFQGGGGISVELSQIIATPAGVTHVLVNDVAHGGLAAFAKLKSGVTPPPTLVFNQPTVSGNKVTVTWTGAGTLQQAAKLTGSASDWTNVTPAPTGNTYTVTIGPGDLFFRLQQ